MEESKLTQVDYQNMVHRIRHLARLALPWGATAAVVTKGDDALLDLGVQRAWHFPQGPDGSYAGYYPSNSFEAIRALEAMREKGAQFLLFPRTAFWWLTYFTELRCHLDSLYKVTVETECCIIYFIQKPKYLFEALSSPDGISVPPPYLMRLVANVDDFEPFFRSGEDDSRSLLQALSANGYSMENFDKVLDFGCGCGRTIRHWPSVSSTKFFGTDYNPFLIEWCEKHILFATFSVNGLSSKLIYARSTFDFVYSISIFTHLDIDTQLFWINEISRILKSGGLFLFTYHGTTRLERMTPDERAVFDAGEIVVRSPEREGSNACATFHSEQSIRRFLAGSLEVVTCIPGGMGGSNQDIALLRKPAET